MTTKRTLFPLCLLLLFGLALGAFFALRLEPSPEPPQARSPDPETPAKPAPAQPEPEILRPATPETEAPQQPKAAPGPAIPAPAIEEAKAEDPDPSTPITIDFVNKDVTTVMHWIAVKCGLQIVVEGEITKSVTFMYNEIDPMQAVRSMCEAYDLDCVEDGKLVIIKERK